MVAPYYRDIADALIAGAEAAVAAAGAQAEVIEVPGALEIPPAIRLASRSGGFDGYVALGCVIRGETPHFEYVCGPCADGVMRAQLDTGVPVMFGVLTVNTQAQADERSVKGAGNKGDEAAVGAVEMALLARSLRS